MMRSALSDKHNEATRRQQGTFFLTSIMKIMMVCKIPGHDFSHHVLFNIQVEPFPTRTKSLKIHVKAFHLVYIRLRALVGYSSDHNMAVDQEFSLRPLLSTGTSVNDTPPVLEGSFRIHMKRDDMRAKDLSNGDPILLRCRSDEGTQSGVGIAWLSSDAPSKNQGSASFVKISNAQKERCGFELIKKCTISPFEGSFRQIATISVTDITAGNVEEASEDELKSWVAISLGK
jgi:hypothetical protein